MSVDDMVYDRQEAAPPVRRDRRRTFILEEKDGKRFCPKCKAWKLTALFGTARRYPDQIDRVCRECRANYARARGAMNRAAPAPASPPPSSVAECCADCFFAGHERWGLFLLADGQTRVCARHLKKRVKERRSEP